ncbi:MAG: sugar transferase [Bacilli bacterium]|nr:sugar transferase [Bacilli bacterium]
MYKKYVKRILDIIFSIILIVILSPIMIIVGLISLITTGNIIFEQNRDGLNKKSFTMYKFKSMKDNHEIPKIMHIIRSLGLDEISQLFNILKGDMSFVGPRPFITNEPLPDDYIDPIIYTVRPGVVGLATAKGRRRVSHTQRLEYDKEYVLNLKFSLDIYIIFETLIVILKQNTRGD